MSTSATTLMMLTGRIIEEHRLAEDYIKKSNRLADVTCPLNPSLDEILAKSLAVQAHDAWREYTEETSRLARLHIKSRT